tara:strand:+ start:64 stop:381 length:318 start_codon:yes stop_codon:yes gene_type:complete
MKLVARAGTCMEEEAVLCDVRDVLTSGDTLVLRWGDDENTWMNVGPMGGTLTDDYVIHTLRPALIAVGEGCFDLWRSSPPRTDESMEDLEVLPESTPGSFLDTSD